VLSPVSHSHEFKLFERMKVLQRLMLLAVIATAVRSAPKKGGVRAAEDDEIAEKRDEEDYHEDADANVHKVRRGNILHQYYLL